MGSLILAGLTSPMMHSPLFLLTLLAALGCGVIAGVFFAFSSFVMKGLARVPPAQGIASMQSVNAAALTPAFMTALFGTAAACLAVIVCSILGPHRPYSGYLLTGGMLYLLGAIGMTITFHVPRNQALDRVRPGSPDAAGHWNRYVTTWTAGNHVRAAAALAAAAILTLALTAH
jgi:uncharacterized membrane protein